LYETLYVGAAVNTLHATVLIRDTIGSCVIKIPRNSMSLKLRFQSLTYLKGNIQIQDGIFPALLIVAGRYNAGGASVRRLSLSGTGQLSFSLSMNI
jgi:hypothetical protein